jgi:hypothetical protein
VGFFSSAEYLVLGRKPPEGFKRRTLFGFADKFLADTLRREVKKLRESP